MNLIKKERKERKERERKERKERRTGRERKERKERRTDNMECIRMYQIKVGVRCPQIHYMIVLLERQGLQVARIHPQGPRTCRHQEE